MDDIIAIINKVLNDEIMIRSILDSIKNNIDNNPDFLSKRKIDDIIIDRFAIVLQYYLVTRDTNTNYTYQDILGEYLVLLNTNLNINPHMKDNIIKNGYLTSCFNGSDKEYVSKYGLDYISRASSEEKEALSIGFNSLKNLESVLGENEYYYSQENQEYDLKTIYLSTPGFSTMQYAMKQSPERLYNGPLKNNNEPIIVGETKEEYIRRCLLNRLSKLNLGSKYVDDVDNVVKTYCTKNPCISFIEISKTGDIPISEVCFDFHYSTKLSDFINKDEINYIDDFLSKSIFIPGHGNLFAQVKFNDMVSLAYKIPLNAISIISVPDLFSLKQRLAILLGYNNGDIINPDFSQDEMQKDISTK